MLRIEADKANPNLARVIPLTYWKVYNDLMRKVPGSRIMREQRHGQKDLWYWTVPVSCLDDLEDVFRDDVVSIVYVTPKWRLLKQSPPPLPDYMMNVVSRPIPQFKLPLYPYQQYGASFLVERARVNKRERGRGYAFLCDDMGLGKSPQSLGAIQLLMNDGELSSRPGEDLVIILGLSVAKIQWIRDTVQKFTDHPGIAIKSVTPAKRRKLWETWPQQKFISLNYELLLQDEDWSWLQKIPIGAIILDEPHQKLMDWNGKMHERVKTLIQERDVPWVFLLSGTPVQADPSDLGSLHDLVDPTLLGSKSKFEREYARYDSSGGFPKIVAYRNLNKLRAITEKHILRRTEEEVEVERPEGEPQNLDVDMTPLQLKLEELISQRRKELRDQMADVMAKCHGDTSRVVFWKGQRRKASEILDMLDGALQGTLAARVALAIDPTWLKDSESEWTLQNLVPLIEQEEKKGKVRAPKIELLDELIDRYVVQEGEKMVIFLTSLKGARRLYKHLARKLGREALAYFVGGMTDQARQDQIDRFMNDPTCMVMIANDAGRSAVNMQVAKYMVHLDLPWNVSSYQQRCGRIQRVGSKHKRVHIFNLIATGSIDEDVLAAWERKQSVQTALIGVREEQSLALQLVMNS